MNIYTRKIYSVTVLTFFILFFVLFFFLAFHAYDKLFLHQGGAVYAVFPDRLVLTTNWLTSSRGRYSIAMAFLAGWGFSGLYGGFWLVCRYIARKSLRFKILSCVFFFIPVWIAMFMGLTFVVPYAVYNLYTVLRDSPNIKSELRKLEVKPYTEMELQESVEKPENEEVGPKIGGRRETAVVITYLFKSTTVTYVAVVIGMAAIYLLTVVHIRPSFLSFIPFIIAEFGFAHLYGTLVVNKKIKKIIAVLKEECDPERYIEILKQLLDRQRRAGNRNYLLLLISTGYLYTWEKELAGELLSRIYIDPKSKKASPISFSVSYFNNLVAYNLDNDDHVSADKNLNKMKELIDKLPAKIAPVYQSLYEIKLYRLKLQTGGLEGCEECFMGHFEKEKDLAPKVNLQFLLAQVYLAQNEKQKAEDALKYVIANGNKLCYVPEAEKILSALYR